MANNKAQSKMRVPETQLHATLRQYQAVMHRDVSTDKAHVYYSNPIQKWMAVVKKGNECIISFHAECPCSKVLNDLVPWSRS